MTSLRRFFRLSTGPNLFAAPVVLVALTAVGVGTFISGAWYIPSLDPTPIQFILALLLLAVFALLCTAVGLLAVLIERLDSPQARDVSSPPPSP